MASGEETQTSNLPLKMFLLGFWLMFLGVIAMIIAAFLGDNVTLSGGAVIIIGPIPIILGAGLYAVLTVFLAAILTIVSLLLFLWLHKKSFSC